MTSLPVELLPGLQPQGFESFREQLRKDFDSAALDSDFCSQLQPAYEQIVTLVEQEVKHAAAVNAAGLTNLLYRVDVSEARAMEAAGEEQLPFHRALAHLIVRRVLQKVMFKQHFAKDGN
jgi:hypothetical protein